MKNKNLGFTEKLGYVFQSSHYIGAPIMIMAFSFIPIAIKLASVEYFLTPISISLTSYYTIATYLPEKLYKAPIDEIVKKYFGTSLIFTKGTIKGLLKDSSSTWIVTKRKSA